MSGDGRVLPFPQAPDGIELRHLRAFVAVAEELNFGRAANRLFVSQPALSRQIRGLEQLLGCELLRRSTHRVELTLAGQALLDRARNLLRDVDRAVSATQAIGGELLTRVTNLWNSVAGLVADDGDLQAARTAFEELHANFAPPAGTHVRPVSAGGVPSLILSPSGESPTTVIYLHGGGYVVGSAFGYQPHAGALAAAAKTGVLTPDYRLAPEHPFPAAVEDVVHAYQWLLATGIPAERVTVAGESSGGGLALSVLLTLKREGIALPGSLVLFCPWVDLGFAHHRSGTGPSVPLSSVEEVRRSAVVYLAGHPIDDPIVDSLSADLTGLPPMLIQAATGDLWLADAELLADRARGHGVDARLELFEVDAHAFQLFWSFLPEAAEAMEAAGAFILERARAEPVPAPRVQTN